MFSFQAGGGGRQRRLLTLINEKNELKSVGPINNEILFSLMNELGPLISRV